MRKIVIIGAGFAGLKLARQLKKNPNFEIWILDKNNYHQFQPLFYQVATAGLEPSSIAFPLRKVFQNYKNVHIRCTEVQRIDKEKRTVLTTVGSFDYDYLVIATGASTNFFGNKEIEQNAIPMKSVSEALHLRNRILQNFEDALFAEEKTRKSLMNIVIVGGGPTGVEVSGALAEMKKQILPKDYPELDFSKMDIYLVEAGAKTLGAMSEQSSQKSKQYLEKLGVKVFTSTSVISYDGYKVKLSNENIIQTKTLIWAAGVKASPVEGLPEEVIARGNRILVNRYHQVKGFENIFALGDVCLMTTPKYQNGHPQVATVANEHAASLAKNLKRMVKGEAMKEFEYKDKGSMATVGRNLAVVDLPRFKFQGFFAWLFWMTLHLVLILGVKNKVLVFINWVWNYITFDQSLRLIIKPFKKQNEA